MGPINRLCEKFVVVTRTCHYSIVKDLVNHRQFASKYTNIAPFSQLFRQEHMKVACHAETREKTVNESWEYEMSNSLKTHQTQVQLASTGWQKKIQKLIGVAKDDLNLALIDDNSLSLSFSPASEVTITSKAKLRTPKYEYIMYTTKKLLRYGLVLFFAYTEFNKMSLRYFTMIHSLLRRLTKTGYWSQSRSRAWPEISLWSPALTRSRIDLIWCVHNCDGLSLVDSF